MKKKCFELSFSIQQENEKKSEGHHIRKKKER